MPFSSKSIYTALSRARLGFKIVGTNLLLKVALLLTNFSLPFQMKSLNHPSIFCWYFATPQPIGNSYKTDFLNSFCRYYKKGMLKRYTMALDQFRALTNIFCVVLLGFATRHEMLVVKIICLNLHDIAILIKYTQSSLIRGVWICAK